MFSVVISFITVYRVYRVPACMLEWGHSPTSLYGLSMSGKLVWCRLLRYLLSNTVTAWNALKLAYLITKIVVGSVVRAFREELTLFCYTEPVNTSPSPTFEWYRNGIRINSSTLIGDVIHSGYGKGYLTLTEDKIQEKTGNYSYKYSRNK